MCVCACVCVCVFLFFAGGLTKQMEAKGQSQPQMGAGIGLVNSLHGSGKSILVPGFAYDSAGIQPIPSGLTGFDTLDPSQTGATKPALHRIRTSRSTINTWVDEGW